MPDLDVLIARCRQGDDLAWEALVRNFQGRVYAVALHYLRDREEARDAAQEIFVKVYRRLDRLETDRAFLPWLLGLARNCCIDRLRRLKTRGRDIEVPMQAAPEMVSVSPSPEQSMFVDARRGLLYRALGSVSEISREMILLKEIQQMKMEEIAELLAVPMGTVKSRSSRARVELAKAVRALDPSYGS